MWEGDFFTGENIIMDYGLGSNGLKLKCLDYRFISYKSA